MTRLTPLSVYLTALSYTTGIVILAGTFAVQAWSEWPTIRGTGTLQPTHHESSHRIEAVKPASRSHARSSMEERRPSKPQVEGSNPSERSTFHAYSSSVTGREWTPSRSTLRSDRGYEPRLSKHGVSHAPARKPSSLRFTETGRGPSLQAVVHAAAALCGVDQPLAWSLALRESSGRHWDASGAVLRSSSGAVGILQIKPSTARDVASDLDVMQPWGNALAALCHFRRLLDKARGDRHLALRWYHRGEYAKGPAPKASYEYATDIIEGSN